MGTVAIAVGVVRSSLSWESLARITWATQGWNVGQPWFVAEGGVTRQIHCWVWTHRVPNVIGGAGVTICIQRIGDLLPQTLLLHKRCQADEPIQIQSICVSYRYSAAAKDVCGTTTHRWQTLVCGVVVVYSQASGIASVFIDGR